MLLSLAAVLAAAGAMWVGAGDLSDPRVRDILLELRAARLAAAFLAGSALAVGGVLVQGLFRNPLASPSILGTTAGASLGGRVALLCFPLMVGGAGSQGSILVPEMIVPLGCVIGALVALMILLVVHRVGDDLVVLLLTGFLLSSLFISLGGFIASLVQERWELARAMIAFSLGDLGGVGFHQVALATPLVVTGIVAAYLWARPLDMMLSGEEEARSLGVDVRELRRSCILWVAVLTAAAVAIGGNIGFVGLVVPHVLRPWIGVKHEDLVPASALMGGTFLVVCDVMTRILPTTSEIPLGVVTGLLGAPTFLFLLVRSRRRHDNGR